jgi:ribosomal subunit interface protein
LNDIKLREDEKKYLSDKLKKVEKLLSGYNDNEVNGEVEVALDKKGFFRVEFMIKTPRDLYRSEKISDTMMNAADQAEEALRKQIRRNKEKAVDAKRKK